MRRPSPSLIGSLVALSYLLLSVLILTIVLPAGEEPFLFFFINPHTALFLGLMFSVLPEFAQGSAFGFLFALLFNWLLGGVIGWGIGKLLFRYRGVR